MNPKSTLWNNKKATQQLIGKLMEYFNSKGSLELKAKDPIFFENGEAGVDVNVLTLVRTNLTKLQGVFAVGTSDNQSLNILKELFPPSPGPDGTTPKTFESEIGKNIFAALEVELKASGHAVDAKNTVYPHGAALADWSTLHVLQSLRIPFTSPKGEFTIDFPIFDTAWSQAKTQEIFGFPETTRIMVVDDMATSRKISRNFLNLAGYFNVDECPDGQQAYTKLISSRPSYGLVVADWHMPNLSGIELLKKIRATPEIKSTPVILATGEKNKDEVAAAIKEGVNGYLVKPVDTDSFYKTLKKVGSAFKAVGKKAAA